MSEEPHNPSKLNFDERDDCSHLNSPQCPCATHENHNVVLYLPFSPRRTAEHDQEKNSKIVTAMMELQGAEDTMLCAIHTITNLSPETALPMEKYISPGMEDCLQEGMCTSFSYLTNF